MSKRIRLPASKTEAQAAATTRRWLERGARDVGRDFTKPDDDWDPIWLVVSRDSGLLIASDETVHKHDMAELVGATARRLGAICVGHVHSSWLILFTEIDEPRRSELVRHMQETGGETEGVPERIEILMLAVYTASTSAMWYGRIERHDDAPPTLARFERAPTDGETTGAMVDPLRAGLVKLG